MKTVESTLDTQIETLRGMGRPWVSIASKALFIVPAVFLLYKAIAGREYGLLPFVLGLGAFAVIVSKGTVHIQRAIRGLDTPMRYQGTVKIRIEESSETTYYTAQVTVVHKGRWTFQFRPQHWIPQEVELEVECRFIPEVSWPVLLLAEQWIILPATVPRFFRQPPSE